MRNPERVARVVEVGMPPGSFSEPPGRAADRTASVASVLAGVEFGEQPAHGAELTHRPQPAPRARYHIHRTATVILNLSEEAFISLNFGFQGFLNGKLFWQTMARM